MDDNQGAGHDKCDGLPQHATYVYHLSTAIKYPA